MRRGRLSGLLLFPKERRTAKNYEERFSVSGEMNAQFRRSTTKGQPRFSHACEAVGSIPKPSLEARPRLTVYSASKGQIIRRYYSILHAD